MKKFREFLRMVDSNKENKCINKKTLINAFTNEITNEEKHKLLDHIAVCPECHREFEALREIQTKGKDLFNQLERIDFSAEDTEQLKKVTREEISKIKSLAREKKRPFFYDKRVLSAISVAGLAIAAIAVLILVKGPLEIGMERKIHESGIELIEPRGQIYKSPLTFQWSPMVNTINYTLEILDRGLETVYHSVLIERVTFKLPEEIFRSLKEGETYFWKITATTQNNEKIESDFGAFKITQD